MAFIYDLNNWRTFCLASRLFPKLSLITSIPLHIIDISKADITIIQKKIYRVYCVNSNSKCTHCTFSYGGFYVLVIIVPLGMAVKVHIFWEGHKILRNLHLALHRTKVRWRFRKILWPSQNIWTLSATIWWQWKPQ